MNAFHIRPIDRDDKIQVGSLLREWWGGPDMVSRGKVHHAGDLPGFVAEMINNPVGVVTYNIENGECEILSLNSLLEGMGIGTALVETVVNKAKAAGCRRLWLIMTNDNTTALRFWQKHGFRIIAVHVNAIEQSRRLKPEIPLTGNDGIPIRDEIELETIL